MKRLSVFVCFVFVFIACKHKESPKAAFYYWKTVLQLDNIQSDLLSKAGNNTLYLRFFDVTWNEQKQEVSPNAIVLIDKNLSGVQVIPVIFMTNVVFERTKAAEVDSLAKKCNGLINALATKANLSFKSIQIDCDWTDGTKDKYFSFLKAFRGYCKHSLQATIRLHQIKYRERTGVPPVDKGVLMFYNMGKIKTGGTASSIYNEKDAAKYLGRLGSYPLPLDVALPLFSWVIQSRDGKVIQIYSKISRNELKNQNLFEALNTGYRAREDFFLKGAYIRKNDVFNPEETNMNVLTKAADQLSDHLPPFKTRTIIYYELANINLPEFTPEALSKVTDRF